MQIDRGIIKWQPFDSVVNTKSLLKSASKELQKNNFKKPILDSEQIENNEKNIINAYHNQESIQIIYFINYKIFKLTSKIKNIDFCNKKITFFNQKSIYFSQIIYTKI